MNKLSVVIARPIIFHLLAAILLVAAGVTCYANTFQAPFHFDDYPNIVENPHVKIDRLTPAALLAAAAQGPSPHRWLPNASFALNYFLHGHAVLGYHLVNLAIHLACGIVLYFLILNTLSLPALAARYPDGRYAALAAALLWLVHPVQTNAVTYIVQRMTSLSALFYLLALLFYVQGRRRIDRNRQAFVYFTLAGLCGVVALFSKETAAMLPMTVVAYEWFFFRDLARKSLTRAALFTGVAGLVFFLIAWFYLGKNPWTALVSGYADRDFTLGQRLLTEPRVIFHYLTLLFLPLPSRLNICYDFPVSHVLLSPATTLLAMFGLVGLIALVFPLYRRHRLPAFALLFFIINLVIESSLIPLELVFEHRLYLPSTFLIAAVVAESSRLFASRSRYLYAVPVLLILILIAMTWQRNTAWQSNISLWSDVAAKSPNLARAHENLGVAYKDAGNLAAAATELSRAIELKPNNGSAYMNLGVVYQMQGRIPEAFAALTQALTLKGASVAGVHNNLGILEISKGDLPAAIGQFNRAVQENPYFYSGYVNLGLAHRDLGRLGDSEEYFRKAMALDPGRGLAYVKLAGVLERQHRWAEAKNLLLIALDKPDTDRSEAHKRLTAIAGKESGEQR